MPVATESWAQPTIFETAFLNGGSQLLAGGLSPLERLPLRILLRRRCEEIG